MTHFVQIVLSQFEQIHFDVCSLAFLEADLTRQSLERDLKTTRETLSRGDIETERGTKRGTWRHITLHHTTHNGHIISRHKRTNRFRLRS